MTAGAEIARAARACVGVPFRPQGRDPRHGLDCLGLVACAFHGRLHGAVPCAYAQRGGDERLVLARIAACGLRPIDPEEAGEGDLLLLATGPRQWHFAVLSAEGFIHADARLRRVTEVPGKPAWRVAGAWRSGEED